MGRGRLQRVLVVGGLVGAMLGCSSMGMAEDKKAEVAEGGQLFATSGCTHCHGENAAGGEIGPSLLGVSKKKDSKALTVQIHDGAGAMPAFGGILTDDQIAALVRYVKTLKAPRAGSGQ
jgi:mono/diheme cytochrome c family protein